MRENFMQVGRDVCSGGMMNRRWRAARRRSGQGEGLTCSLGGEDKRELHHRACAGVKVLVTQRLRVLVVIRRDCHMSGLVELDHVHSRLETLVMHRRREWLNMVEADEYTDVKELILADAEIAQNGLFGDKSEGGWVCGEVYGCNELVHTRVEKGVCRPIDGMDVRFRVALEIDQLWGYGISA